MVSPTLISYTQRVSSLGRGNLLPFLKENARALSSAVILGKNAEPSPHLETGKEDPLDLLIRPQVGSTVPFFRKAAIPSLPLLESLKHTDMAKQVARKVKEEKPYLVATLHGFRTNASLIKFLIDLGFDPKKIYLADKFYSTSPHWATFMRELGVNYYEVPAPEILGGYNITLIPTLQNMWKEVKKQALLDPNLPNPPKFLVLGDGGDVFKQTPADLRVFEMGGVEQTTAGIKKIEDVIYPVVKVASSATKIYLEPLLIAKDIFLHLQPFLEKEHFPSSKTCGIVGNGVIGTALAMHLKKLGFNVWVYDKKPHAFANVRNNVIVCDNLKNLLENCDYVFGCTGENVFAQNDIDSERFIVSREKNITFFSCSSSNTEWEDIIYAIRRNTDTGKGRLAIPPMSNVDYVTPQNATITIANMGYPINFDRHEETIPDKSIALTRALMAIGAMQAYLEAKKPIADGHTINRPERLALHAGLQKFITHQWLRDGFHTLFPPELVQKFQDEIWIAENSQRIQPKHDSPTPSQNNSSTLRSL